MYDVAIIGAGIVGASLFRELGRFRLSTILIEKENDVACGSSRANSAIVHAGYDPVYGSHMARFNVEGNRLYDQLCSELTVPFRRNGSLVLGYNDEDNLHLTQLYENGIRNGVPNLALLKPEEILAMEPNLDPTVTGALWAPTGGIVGAYELTIALAENGLVNGGEILLNSEVRHINRLQSPCGFEIVFNNDLRIRTRFLINAAGLASDKIHNMVAPPSFRIHPRKGEYFLFDRTEGQLVERTIFRVPSRQGKGVLISPTVHGNLIVGPNACDINDIGDTTTTQAGQEEVRRAALALSKKLNFRKNIRNFAGVRALPDRSDFVIEPVKEVHGMIDLAGIKSPGLTSAPAIALAARDMLADMGLELVEKENFIPTREQTHFMLLSEEEKIDRIKKDPAFGRIICRCESITMGEILEAIRRPLGARTVDGVKRRCRPGCGRCQGGFCSPKVIALLAQELECSEEEILQNLNGSWIISGRTK